MGRNQQNLLLRIENCSKGFPGVQALKNIDLKLHEGEIHCIVGENGAGKSTLIKILSGALQPDTGRIVYLGSDYKSFSPKQAQLLGIQTIYQEIELIQYMTVAENIFLGHEKFLINYKEIRDKAAILIKSFGVDINPGDLITDLPIAQKQTVQILRALAMEARILIMDEPTASFSKSEIKHLLNMTRSIAEKGVGIIYISHHLEEVFEIHDSITVLRDGEKVAWHGKNEVSADQLICEMVGRCTDMFYNREKVPVDKTKFIEFKGFKRGDKVKDISFRVYKGEVLGISGMVGAGRTELVRAIFGADRKDGGDVYINGQKVMITSPRHAVKAGMGLITEDRQRSGIILRHTIETNISVVHMNKTGGMFMNTKKDRGNIEGFIDRMNIRTPSLQQVTNNLSGGNQQKVVLAKWLYANSNIIIFDEPTRGIDIGAKEEIYKLIVELAKEGKYIIIISSDMPELISMSDRVIVIRKGELVGELDGSEISEENILSYSIGGAI